jgi:hypothetical protein
MPILIDMKILIVGKTSFIAQGVAAWFAKKEPAPRGADQRAER